MSIPSSQIDTWFQQGPITSSSITYQSIKNALTHINSPIAKMISSGRIKIDLQGSYAHDTNIYGDSDVDVMVHYTNSFASNKQSLSREQYDIHQQCYSPASYDWYDLRKDVAIALEKYYGKSSLDETGNKSLKILPGGGRLRADIVPVISYREYDYFYGISNHMRKDGVAFYHKINSELIVNYPNQHYENAVKKQKATNDRYKGMVRIIKNMRSYLINKGRLRKDDAPSYFLQGMVYNVPNNLFENDKAITTLQVLRWLRGIDPQKFLSQNGQHALLGYRPEYWNPVAAKKTINELCCLWDNWGRI